MELLRPKNWSLIRSTKEIEEMVAFLREPIACAPGVPAAVGLDYETSGLNPRTDKLCVAQLANAQASFVIPFKEVEEPAKDALRSFLVESDKRPPLLAHNANFEWRFSAANGALIPDKLIDTFVLEQLLTAGLECERGLEESVARRLKLEMTKFQQTSFWLAPSSKYTRQQLEYAAADAECLIDLYANQYRELVNSGLLAIAELETSCVCAYARMGWAGFAVDRKGMEALAKEKAAEAEALAPKVIEAMSERRVELDLPSYQPLLALDGFATVDPGFSLTSPTELGRELVALGVPLERTEKSLQEPHKKPTYITDKKALKEFAIEYPFLEVLADYSVVSTEAQDASKILGILNKKTDRCYPDFQQNFAATGRSSTKNPNSQNIPRSKSFRSKVVPGRDRHGEPMRFILCDYGQVELKVVAEITRDKEMLATYNLLDADGNCVGDLHRKTAAACNNISESDVDSEARRGAKGVNFGLIFGMGARKLRQTCFQQYNYRMSESDAELFRERYFALYKGVADWHAEIEADLRKGHYSQVISLGGRRRLLTADDKRLNLIANTYVQSVAANIMKLAISRMEDAFREFGLKSARMVNVIHDELITEVNAEESEICCQIVQAVMEDAEEEILPSVAPEAEAKIATSWADK